MSNRLTIEEEDALIKEEEQCLKDAEEFVERFFPVPEKPRTYHLLELILDVFIYAVIIKGLFVIWKWMW